MVVDQETLNNGQRPDVLVSMPGGQLFAFELQYSPLSVSEWRRRHDGYVTQRVIDVWLFGHLPPHLRRSRYNREQRFESAIELTELGVPLPLWVSGFGSSVRTSC